MRHFLPSPQEIKTPRDSKLLSIPFTRCALSLQMRSIHAGLDREFQQDSGLGGACRCRSRYCF
jgi:hypothetical protein